MKAENKQIDIAKEVSNLFIKITLRCLFGGDNTNLEVLQKINGKESLQPLGETMITLLE
jgi:hypothetical protein